MSDFFKSFIGNPDAVIIANGNYPTHEIPLSYIDKATYIVCCDGAANLFIDRGGHPDAIVGDCDSISEENKTRFADIIHPDPDQYTNDLTKSVLLRPQSEKSVCYRIYSAFVETRLAMLHR
jgi:thiamine pyrophosphokinase